MKTLLLAAWLLINLAAPAHAAPVIGFVSGIVASLSATAVGSFVLRMAASAVLSAVSKALAGKRKNGQRGITTEVTLTGDLNPQSFILGKYATGGVFVCTPLSHTVGGTPNDHLTQIIDLGDFTGATLEGLFFNSERVEIGTETHPDYGLKIMGDYENYAWVKFYDGTQTVADPMLLDKYSDHPDRPWSSDMIGRGKVHAIVTTKLHDTLWNGQIPNLRFELGGMPLYDVRKDDTAGGTGAHRWDDPTTWETTENNIVQVYNILRGITLPDGRVWGGAAQAEDLPVSEWAAAMNVCDYVRDTIEGPMKVYRAGLEVLVNEEPAAVIEKLLLACNGEIAPDGGVFHIRAGAVNLPAFYITDDDILGDRPQRLDPWPTLDQTVNGVEASFPNPEAAWEPTDAPPLYRADLEAEDQGRRLVQTLDFSAVPYKFHVQWLMHGFLNDARRFRRHSVPLGPDAAFLSPLDVLGWTSDRNGYDAKLFEVENKATDPRTYSSVFGLHEVDPGAYDWTEGDEKPTFKPPTKVTVPDPHKLVCVMDPRPIEDGAGAPKKAAVALSFVPFIGDGVEWEVRDATTLQTVSKGATLDTASGSIVVSDGVVPAQVLEGRLKAVGATASEWSDWVSVTVDDVRPGLGDLSDALGETITSTVQNQHGIELDVLALAEASLSDIWNGFTTAQELAAAEATIAELSVTRVTEDEALAAVSTQVSAHFGSLSAMAQQTAFAVATANGVESGIGWIVDGGFLRLASMQNGVFEPVETVFSVGAGVLDFSESGMAIFGGVLQADNYVPGVAGWRIGQDGTIEARGLEVYGDMIADGRIKVVYDAQSGHGAFKKTVVSNGNHGTIALSGQANATQVMYYFEVLPDGINGASFSWAIVCENSAYFANELVLASGSETVPAGGPSDFVIERTGVGFSGRPLNPGDTIYLRITGLTGSFELEGQINAEQTLLVGGS